MFKTNKISLLFKEISDSLINKFKKVARPIKALFNQGKVVYQVKTPFNHIQVVEKKSRRYLIFKDTTKLFNIRIPEAVYQSFIDLDNTDSTPWSYAEYFYLSWVFNPGLQDVLMIGLGGGAIPKLFLRDHPEVRFTTVEIDPAVAEVAYKYFNLPQDSRNQVIIADGRKYIQKCGDTFDLIIMDAFFAQSVPHQLYTREFFAEAKDRLNKRGIFAINLIGSISGPNSWLFRSLYQTLDQVFPTIFLFASKKTNPQQVQNIFLFNLPEAVNLTKDQILSRVRLSPDSTIKGLADKIQNLVQTKIDLGDASILTDSNPVPGGVLRIRK